MKKPKYTIGDLNKAIKNRYENNLPMTLDSIRNDKNSSWMFSFARKYYGTWNNALIANKIKPVQLKQKSTYTKQDVIIMFKKDYHDSSLYRKYSRSIKKYFGSVDNLKNYLELNKKDEINYLSKDEINKLIYSSIDNITYTSKEELNNINPLLFDSIKFHYDSIINYFSNIINIDLLKYSNKLTFQWTKENIKRTFIDLVNNSKVNYTYMKANNKSFYNSIRKHFGSYENLFNECGLNYKDYKIGEQGSQDRYWTENRLKEFILNRIENDKPINSSYLAKHHNNVLVAIQRYHGSYKEFIEDICKLNYDDICVNGIELSKYGYEFEYLLGDILNDLDINFDKYTTGNPNLQPDFILKNKVWFDAKLSDYTYKSSKTIKKYEPHCNLLTIVYMLGNKNVDEMITEKTRLLSVHKIIKQLPKYKQKYYLNEIEKIENDIHNIEDNQVSQ